MGCYRLFVQNPILIYHALQDSAGASMPQVWTAMRADPDLWEDTAMEEVWMYLRGAKALQVPHELREALGMNA